MHLHLHADLASNYQRFLRRVVETQEVWGLRSDQGWAYCLSNDSAADVLLFWSDRAYAQRHANAEWSAYRACAIDLASFISNWLPGMQADGVLVGANFNADLAGLEISAEHLRQALLLHQGSRDD